MTRKGLERAPAQHTPEKQELSTYNRDTALGDGRGKYLIDCNKEKQRETPNRRFITFWVDPEGPGWVLRGVLGRPGVPGEPGGSHVSETHVC